MFAKLPLMAEMILKSAAFRCVTTIWGDVIRGDAERSSSGLVLVGMGMSVSLVSFLVVLYD